MKTLKKVILGLAMIGFIGLFSGCAQLADATLLASDKWYTEYTFVTQDAIEELSFDYKGLTYQRIARDLSDNSLIVGNAGTWIVKPYEKDTSKSVLELTANKMGSKEENYEIVWEKMNDETVTRFLVEVSADSLKLTSINENSNGKVYNYTHEKR